MNEGFGARLRQRREARKMDLIAIASQTKIKQSLLEALERDDVSQWPGGIFRRAYVRAYAQAIGLNPDDVLQEFLEAHPEPVDVVTTDAIVAAVEAGRHPGGPPTRLRYIMGSALESLTRLRRASVEPPATVTPEIRVEQPADREISIVEAAPAPVHSEEPQAASIEEASAEATTIDTLEPASPVPSMPDPIATPDVPEPDLVAFAQLCTELGRVETAEDLRSLLRTSAGVLSAPGLIVWVWDGESRLLVPTLAHGYPDRMLAQLPTLRADADNATAAAFRSHQSWTVSGSPTSSAGIVVPLLAPRGCAGVLAIELPHGTEERGSVRAVATILAAMLTQLLVPAPYEAQATESVGDVAAEAPPARVSAAG